MTLRTRHLACLFLLISSIGAAQASASPVRSGFYGHQISALLYRHAMDAHRELAQQAAASIREFDPATLNVPANSRATFTSAWMMKPPAAQSATMFAVTGFGRPVTV